MDPSAPLTHDFRGSRRTQGLARGLAWGVALGAFVVGSVLGVGLWSSLRSHKPAVPLMNVPAVAVVPAVANVDEAPSRDTPAVSATVPMLAGVATTEATDVTPTQNPEFQPVTFDGRPLRAVKTLRMKTTAYSPDERSCGKWADGITASGYSVWTNGGKLVAADTKLLPFGSLVSVPGYHDGKPVPVLDRGGAIKGHRLDLLYATHEVALQWGVQDLEVTVWEYAD